MATALCVGLLITMKKYDFVNVFGGAKVVEMALEACLSVNLTRTLRYYYNSRTRRDWMKYQDAGNSTMRYRVSHGSQNTINQKSLERNKERVKQGLSYLLEANASRNKKG